MFVTIITHHQGTTGTTFVNAVLGELTDEQKAEIVSRINPTCKRDGDDMDVVCFNVVAAGFDPSQLVRLPEAGRHGVWTGVPEGGYARDPELEDVTERGPYDFHL